MLRWGTFSSIYSYGLNVAFNGPELTRSIASNAPVMTRSIALNVLEMTRSLACFAGRQLRLPTRGHHHGY